MNIVLFDQSPAREQLLPFTFTRPVASIRTGILTIGEKWERWLAPHIQGAIFSHSTARHLSVRYPLLLQDDNLLISGHLCPDEKLVETIRNLKPGSLLQQAGNVLALRTSRSQAETFTSEGQTNDLEAVEYEGSFSRIDYPWDIFSKNAEQIRLDFTLITRERASAPLRDEFTKVYGMGNLFIEEGAEIRAAIIDAESGPVYIGKDAHVHEGAIIKGPFALCEGSHINMGAKMRGDSTVGPFSKVGGEVSNSVIFGYSNKGHEGFLGNSVIGEWCNLGADTNTSNLKNNYAPVKLWSYAKGGFANSGLQFCGLMMGDHSKCGINTMFNTGTVVGVSANIFGSGFPRNFIPSFAWGGANGFTTFQLKKSYEVAELVMQRRGVDLSEADKSILDYVFNETAQYRNWEKA
ncbi:GlmU family protein [Roseivirga sp. BDSF3-8]|uniref:GlmU family protein n=1 Tax=Roseivirga sp. BDSF3-8 TaxID=3241598 RepID=UPI0035321A57